MRHTAKLLGAGLAVLAVGTVTRPAHAQTFVNTNNTVYDSLTDLTQRNGAAQTGTTDVTGDYTLTARGAQKSSGAGAYATRFGYDLATAGGANVNNTLSTALVTDDLYLRVAANASGGNATAFTLNTFRTLLTNETTNALNVTLNLRFYSDDGIIRGNGGYAGTLLYSAAQNVTLAAGSASVPDVTQVQYDFSSSPLFFNNFNTAMNANYYEKRIWVGLFVTADASAVTLSDFNSIGTITYDTDLSTRDNSPFKSDAGTARSTDLIYGDDTSNIAGNTPYNKNLYDYQDGNAANEVDLPGGARYRLAQTLNGTTNGVGPDANFAFFLSGTTFDVPEPGSLGFALAGAAPLGLLILRRARRKSA